MEKKRSADVFISAFSNHLVAIYKLALATTQGHYYYRFITQVAIYVLTEVRHAPTGR